MAFRVDGTGTASIQSGSKDATLTDNGTGDYTLTFAQAFGMIPMVQVTAVTANIIANIAAVSTTAVQITTFQGTDGTTATDADFHVFVMGFDAAEEV